MLFLKCSLYGLCDVGDYWEITLDDHAVNELEMRPTVGDQALYTKSQNSKIIGVSGLYVDDSLNAGTLEFEKLTESTLQYFESKPRKSNSFDFYGAHLNDGTPIISNTLKRLQRSTNFDVTELSYRGLSTPVPTSCADAAGSHR